MSAESLAPLLEEMFRESCQTSGGVHRQLPGGLHVKVRERGGKRMLIVWRSGRKLPGATECEIVGQDAGLFHPKFRTWQCQESDLAYLITDGFDGDVCAHAWGPADPFVEGKTNGERSVCTRCGADWTRTTGPRGKVTLTYSGQVIKREPVWARWLVTGPAPAAQVEEVEAIPSEVLEELGSRPAPAQRRQDWRYRRDDKPPVDREAQARQQERDALERTRLSGLLLCVSFWCACWDPWFQRHVVIGMRRAHLKGAPLDELRGEVRGGYHQRTYPHAWRYVLLALRWRHVARALPEHATLAPAPTPTPKPKRKSAPRKRKATP